VSEPLWQVHFIQFHSAWKLALAGKYNGQFSQLHYALWDNLLMKPLFVTSQSCAKFLSWAVRALLLCCHSCQCSKEKQVVWKILNTCEQLWVWLCAQWSNLNLLTGRRLLLAQTTHPSLLHSVIVIGFHPCFMRKEMFVCFVGNILRPSKNTTKFSCVFRLVIY
jgi:hypothetical protein